jgi:hypothetical protein
LFHKEEEDTGGDPKQFFEELQEANAHREEQEDDRDLIVNQMREAEITPPLHAVIAKKILTRMISLTGVADAEVRFKVAESLEMVRRPHLSLSLSPYPSSYPSSYPSLFFQGNFNYFVPLFDFQNLETLRLCGSTVGNTVYKLMDSLCARMRDSQLDVQLAILKTLVECAKSANYIVSKAFNLTLDSFFIDLLTNSKERNPVLSLSHVVGVLTFSFSAH